MPPRVFIISPHLGVVRRGFETSSWAMFQALKDSPEIELHLIRGAQSSGHPRDRAAWSFPIGSRANKLLSILSFRTPEVIAQDTFFWGLLPQLFQYRPQLLVLQDRHLAHRLYHARKFLGLEFKITFINGGPFLPPFPRFDHVQHLTEFHLQQSLNAGDAKEKLSLLPYGDAIPCGFFPPTADEKQKLRAQLGLPADRVILLSSAALNKSHKRIDYLIEEVAALPASERPFLAMFGALTDDTPELLLLAAQKLGLENFVMNELPATDMPTAYRAADIFVLSSLSEGFGKVLAEALAAGLPCLAHDYPVAQCVLGGYGLYANFTQPGALAKLISSTISDLPCQAGYAADRHAYAYERYSWDTLAPKYISNFLRVLG